MEKKDGHGPKGKVGDPFAGVSTDPAGAIRGQKENPSRKNGIPRRGQAPRDIPSKAQNHRPECRRRGFPP
jgi:hypothetical protein